MIDVLSRFIESVRYAALPEAEQTRAKVRILLGIGCALAGRPSEPSRRAQTFAAGRAGNGPSSFWLSNAKGSIEDCVFVNSILIHSLMLDDSPHMATVVVPAALALGEAHSRTGSDVLAAVVIGYEVLQRIQSAGLGDKLDDTGFRRAAMPGAFGAASTAAYLCGLPAAGIADALALAVSTCAPGSYEPVGEKHGSSERYLQLAVNARAGVLAAELAAGGFHGVPSAFDGEAGLFAIYGSQVPPSLADALGTRWHTERTRLKPYPGGTNNTAAIWCAEQLVREHAVRPDEIAALEVRMVPWGHTSGADYRGPFTNLEQALFSAPFAVAATLLRGSYDADALLTSIGEPEVDALAARIAVVDVKRKESGGIETSLVASLTDGRTVTVDSDERLQALRAPTWDVMVARFHRLAKDLSEPERERIVSEVWELDRRSDCSALLAQLRR